MNSLAEVELGMKWHTAVRLLNNHRQMFPSMSPAKFQEAIGSDFDKTIEEIRTEYKQLGLPADQSVFLEVEDHLVCVKEGFPEHPQCQKVRERYRKAVAKRRELEARGVDLRLS